MTTPLWLKSAGVQGLLNHLVDKLDAASQQGTSLVRAIKLDTKSFPALFRAELEAAREQQWGHLLEMAAWGWFKLKLDKERILGQAAYERNPRLEILDEAAIRVAVGRQTRIKTPNELWREAVSAHLVAEDTVKEVVFRFRIEIPGRTAEQLVQQLGRLPSLREEPLLLREVSARLFWGQSKVLDGRQPLVAALLGLEECPFPEMPVQLQVFLPPAGFDGVLFIENQATFEQATRDSSGRYARLALVFASGFKGSARRLRTPAGASIYFALNGSLDTTLVSHFRDWLWGAGVQPVWFWGDLDFSGMRILAALRAVFNGLRAWEPGYLPMLTRLEQGGGHAPDAAGKEGQLRLQCTGCEFADNRLLPALTRYGTFIDQEVG